MSIHAAREGGDHRGEISGRTGQFQSTPPVKAATQLVHYLLGNGVFQSTPPVKAATIASSPLTSRDAVFQSTPPVKAATLFAMTSYEIDLISIHAAREGGDVQVVRCKDCVHFISIHAAREGGDGLPNCSTKLFAAFQSTPPVKAATR